MQRHFQESAHISRFWTNAREKGSGGFDFETFAGRIRPNGKTAPAENQKLQDHSRRISGGRADLRVGGSTGRRLHRDGCFRRTLRKTAVSITLVFLSALFTGLNLYPKLAKFAGAGTLVPITGFANSVVSPALEFKTEGLILGLGAKLFIIAGPVLTYGVSASVIYGFFYWLWSIR